MPGWLSAGDRLQVRCEPLLAGGENRFGTHKESLSVRRLVLSVAGVSSAFFQCCERVCPPLLMRTELMEWRRLVENQVARLHAEAP